MSNRHLLLARRNLTGFVTEQAEAASRRLGFGWRASELAPESFKDLQHEHRSSELSRLPLRISPRFSERTIYCSRAANHAMRFWHDTSHVQLGLNFTPDDEIELGCYHLEVLRANGFTADSLEHRLLHADTIGQTLCHVTIGRWPIDQLRFAHTASRFGIGSAIEDVASRELNVRTASTGEVA